jgi:Zn-dependent protease
VPDNILASVIVVAIMLLIGFPVHEFSHALAAYRLGDSTAKHLGRLTLNPIAHFDPLGGILLAVTFIGSSFGFGWAKPTPVNPNNLEGGRWGEAIVAAAGPISNLVLAIAAAIPLRYILANRELAAQLPSLVISVLLLFVLINIVLMIFNLIPIPPLDGSRIVGALLPRDLYARWAQLDQVGMFALFGLIFIFNEQFWDVFGEARDRSAEFMVRVVGG